MELKFDENYRLFLLSCSAADSSLAKRAGFKFVKEWQLFVSPHLHSVKKVANLNDSYTQNFIREMEKVFDTEYKASMAATPYTAFTVPLPEGKVLKPYQFAGVEYLARRMRSLLADDMGLGKTIEIIAACNLWNKIEPLKRILIVCPANARINWMREWMQWSTLKGTPSIGTSCYFPNSPVVIINYDILVKLDDHIKAVDWDVVIFDEAHMLKESKSARTKIAFGGYDIVGGKRKWQKPISTKRTILATGSPIVNYTIELFPLLKFLSPYGWGDKMSFARRYCDLKVIAGRWDFKGSSNLEELQYKLRSTVMLRRTKDLVAKFLPPKIRTIYELEPTGKLAKRSATITEAAKEVVGGAKGLQEYTNEDWEKVISGLKNWRNKDNTVPIATIREEEAREKIPLVVSHLKLELQKHKKVVLFCYHRVMAEELRKKFADISVSLTGETSQSDRQKVVDRFQNDESVHLFIGNVRAAGTAITLTAASIIIFAEYDWTPGIMYQAEDRIHRIGQTADHVIIQYLAVKDTIDAHMLKTIMGKTKTIDKAVNDRVGLDKLLT